MLVLGRDEAIYLYGPDERGPCFAFDGPKHSILWHGSSLVVITKHEKDEPASYAGGGAAAAGATSSAGDVGALVGGGAGLGNPFGAAFGGGSQSEKRCRRTRRPQDVILPLQRQMHDSRRTYQAMLAALSGSVNAFASRPAATTTTTSDADHYLAA